MNGKMKRLIFACLGTLAAAVAVADDVPRAPAEQLGFSSERLKKVDMFYEDKVAKGEMAGIVLLIARRGKIVHFSAVGYANVETRQPMKTDTVFRLYSMTKPITATALMMLYEEGAFRLEDPVSKYLPDFLQARVLRKPDSAVDDTVPVERPATIEDLLRHTAGFTHCFGTDVIAEQCNQADVFGFDISLGEMVTRLARIPLAYQPETSWAYSVAADVQARLVEVISNVSFEAFLRERLFRPLGMKDTGFGLTATQERRLATVHWLKQGRVVPWDDIHGHPSSYDFGPHHTLEEPWTSTNKEAGRKLVRGSLGLFGTAADYWRFVQMLANGGELNGVRVLNPQIVRNMARDHIGSIDSKSRAVMLPPGTGWGLGFAVTKDAAAAGYPGSDGTIWWVGAATTLWWADPEKELVVVAMAQYLDYAGLNYDVLRPQLHGLVYGAMLN